MKKNVLTIVALALAVAMCITIPVSSDDSDAFDIVTGEAGLRWDSSKLSTEDIGRLIDDTQIKDEAREVLTQFVISSYSYDLSEVVISDATLSVSTGIKVTSDAITYADAETISYKITFKATCNSSGEDLLRSMMGSDLIAYVCFSNQTQNGAVFEVSADVTKKDASIYTEHLTKTNSGNYVVSGEEYKESENCMTLKADVKYTYTVDAQSVERNFSLDSKFENSYNANTKITFDGKAEDATDDTDTLRVYALTKAKYAYSLACSFNGKTVKNSFDLSDSIGDEQRSVGSTKASIFYEGDIEPPQISYYSELGNAMFYHVADPTLRSNDALKAFLQEHGTTNETFSSALDLAESNIDVGSGSKLLLYAGIGVAVAAVAAVGYFLFVRRKA